jgi:uncharacterized membrane protein
MRFFWVNFPIFIVWLTGLGMLETSLHSIVPPLVEAAGLTIIPLVTTLVLLGFAQWKENRIFVLRRFFLWAFALTAFYSISWFQRASVPLGIETHRIIYEASAIIEFFLLVLHARTWLRECDWVWIFGVTLVFGMILENGGIMMGFFREEGYLLYVPGLPAPIATMLGWVNVLYCGYFAVEKLLPEMRPVLRSLVCTGIALSMDISFDPVATRLSWWVWNHDLTLSIWGVPVVNYVAWFPVATRLSWWVWNHDLTLSIWGVPVVNYVAWFWALFPYVWCYYRVRLYGRRGEWRKVALFSALIPVILVVELGGVVVSLYVLGDQGALEIVRQFFRQLDP